MNVEAYGDGDRLIGDLLPNRLPTRDLIDQRLVFAANLLPRVSLIILLWMAALARAIEERQLWKGIRGIRYFSFGLADPDREGVKFAAIAHVRPDAGVDVPHHNVDVDGHVFPIFARRDILLEHSPAIFPTHGVSACFASSTRYTGRALLTAEHVVRLQLGMPPRLNDLISLIDRDTHAAVGQGRVVDIATPGIDAILIEPPSATPPHNPPMGMPLDVNPFVAPLMDAFILLPGRILQTKVTDVSDPRHFVFSHFPCRVSLADSGQYGDSGALIQDSNRRAIGIYMGAYSEDGEVTHGLAQHLGQAVHDMNLSLLD
jgi:hypothetical protein